MDLLTNLLSPIILAFVLGFCAILLKSDLKIPEPIYAAFSLYLLMAIGLKGGIALRSVQWCDVWPSLSLTLIFGSLCPLWVFVILKKMKFNQPNAAAMAAHYGSVSVVTFMTAQSFVKFYGIEYEGFLPSLIAVMEVPAIIVGLVLGHSQNLKHQIKQVMVSKSILLLLGGIVIGLISHGQSLNAVKDFFITPFQGVLMLFLLEMGTVAAKHIHDISKVGMSLLIFATIAPLCHGFLGIMLAYMVDMSMGGAVIFASMCASASYIAAPASVRAGIPLANPSYYLTSSLAITFPLNIALGIPLYFQWARWMYSQ
jgi:hypothetical protein